MMEPDIFDKSREYIQEGKFEKAQIILRRALSEDPKNAKALDLLGDLAMKMGRMKEATQRYEQAGSVFTNTNQYPDAIICLEKIALVDKRNEEVFSRLSDLYRFYGLPNRAISTILDVCSWALENKEDGVFVSALRKVVEAQSKNLALRLSFVKILLAIDRHQEAQDELKKLKSLAADVGDTAILEEVERLLLQTDGGEELDPKSRIELGNLLYEIGSKDEAIVEFEKAVSDLLQTGEQEEAVKVLNRIVEIDPNNQSALDKIKEITGEAGIAETAEEATETPVGQETISEEETILASAPSEEEKGPGIKETIEEEKPVEPPKIQMEESFLSSEPEKMQEEPSPPVSETEEPPPEEAMKMFEDLGKEIDGFVAAGEQEKVPPSQPTESETPRMDDTAHLEGQIADIEFLLKQAEAPPKPSFEVMKEFDGFKNSIVWQEEDSMKKLNLGKMAFEAGLYESALSYVIDIKRKKETWPLSLELHGGSLVKLGRYNEAMRTIAQSLLLEEIGESEKIELRYLLASAYEGLGDFDNALRETERILKANPNYKDVKEMYTLLGGKELITERPKDTRPTPLPEVKEEIAMRQEPSVEVEESFPAEPAPTVISETLLPSEESYPTIIQEGPGVEEAPQDIAESDTIFPEEKMREKTREETSETEERPGENITFL